MHTLTQLPIFRVSFFTYSSHSIGTLFFLNNLIQKNSNLEVLNLSWNGFGMEGCHELGKALKVNAAITDLDLAANRVNYDCFKLILRGLKKNKTVRKLRVRLLRFISNE